MSSIARGPRGSYVPGRGDITGRALVANSERQADHEAAKKRTMNALISGEPSVLVEVPGGSSYLIPREAFNEVFARGEGSA